MASARVWDSFLTERDLKVAETCGQGQRMGIGDKVALLVVDVTVAFCGERPEPILDSIATWRNSCGEEAWDGVSVIASVISAARQSDVPVIYSAPARLPLSAQHAGRWASKNGRKMEDGDTSRSHGFEIVEPLKPLDHDLVIRKSKPSAFFGTLLTSYLVDLGVDTLICCGTTTSGCVRATVIDAFSYNYRVSVVEDGCFDRTQASHALSLFDLDQKYADVISSAEAIQHIRGIPARRSS